MKKTPIPAFFVFASLFFGSIVCGAQDASMVDSVDQIRIIKPFPDSTITSKISFSYYPVNNELIKNINAATSVLTNFYGQIPGLPLDFQSAYELQRGLRLMSAPMYIVDGMPYNIMVGQLMNLDNFEIGEAAVAPDVSGSASFGVWGAKGAYAFESKTGEGYNDNFFEINSATSLATSEVDKGLYFVKSKYKTTRQSTHLAWSRDFGRVDSRIAVNHRIGLAELNPGNRSLEDNFLSFSTNTGYHANKLSARFIGKMSLRKLSVPMTRGDGKDGLYSGHLKLSYPLQKNLAVSSGLLLQKRDSDLEDEEFDGMGSYYSVRNHRWESRRTANLFLTHKYEQGAISLKSFGGFQTERWSTDSYLLPDATFNSELNGSSALLGIETTLGQYHFVQASTRRDFAKNEAGSTTSFGYAFNFFPSGNSFNVKLRTNYGFGSVGHVLFPDIQAVQNYFTYSRAFPAYVGFEKKSFEAGVDLVDGNGFLLTTTYYHTLLQPGAGSPFSAQTKINGVELIASRPARVGNTFFENRITGNFSKAKNGLFESFYSTSGVNPDISVSLLNQIRWHELETSWVADFRKIKGGDVLMENGTYCWLRHVAVMYTMNDALPQANVSIGVVGRNLLLSKPSEASDPEYLYYATREIALNINVKIK